jgi:beta-phosphoglucomutase
MNDAGVIFDMDGVLVDSADAHYRSWLALATEIGKKVSRERFAATFGRTNRDIIPLLFGPVSEVQCEAHSRRKEVLYRESVRSAPPIMEGAPALLRDLCRAGFRLAVGSSGPKENVELIVRAMQAEPMFAALVTAEDVTRGKPAPDVFLVAASRLGLSPQRCVVIEDAPAGIAAAREAGAIAVALLSTHRADDFPATGSPAGPHRLVRRLAEIHPEILRDLLTASP